MIVWQITLYCRSWQAAVGCNPAQCVLQSYGHMHISEIAERADLFKVMHSYGLLPRLTDTYMCRSLWHDWVYKYRPTCLHQK